MFIYVLIMFSSSIRFAVQRITAYHSWATANASLREKQKTDTVLGISEEYCLDEFLVQLITYVGLSQSFGAVVALLLASWLLISSPGSQGGASRSANEIVVCLAVVVFDFIGFLYLVMHAPFSATRPAGLKTDNRFKAFRELSMPVMWRPSVDDKEPEKKFIGSPYVKDEDALRRRITETGKLAIFFSSPFGGFEAERELFVVTYLPLLRAMCAARNIRLDVVDLRWGITTAQFQDNQTIELCMREVREAEIFVGMIAARYGSSTRQEKNREWIDASVDRCIDEFPILHQFRHCSITEMEYRYGCMENIGWKPSFFLFRHGHYDQKCIMAASDDMEFKYKVECGDSASALAKLKDEIRTLAYDDKVALFDEYPDPMTAAANLFAALEDFLDEVLPMDTYEMEKIQKDIMRQAYGHGAIDEKRLSMTVRLSKIMSKKSLNHTVGSSDDLDNDGGDANGAELESISELSRKSGGQEILDSQTSFIVNAAENYVLPNHKQLNRLVERVDNILVTGAQLDEFMEDLTWITGIPGSGKSSFLAYLVKNYFFRGSREGNCDVAYYFHSPSATTVDYEFIRDQLSRMIVPDKRPPWLIGTANIKVNKIIKRDPLSWALDTWLREHKHELLFIFLDGLENVVEGNFVKKKLRETTVGLTFEFLKLLKTLCQRRGDNDGRIKVMLTSSHEYKQSPSVSAALKKLRSGSGGGRSSFCSGCKMMELDMIPMSSSDKKHICDYTASRGRKTLDQDIVDMIIESTSCENPRFLNLLVDELLHFGSFDKLDIHARRLMKAGNVQELLSFQFDRLETAFNALLDNIVKEIMLTSLQNELLTLEEMCQVMSRTTYQTVPMYYLVYVTRLVLSSCHGIIQLGINNRYHVTRAAKNIIAEYYGYDEVVMKTVQEYGATLELRENKRVMQFDRLQRLQSRRSGLRNSTMSFLRNSQRRSSQVLGGMRDSRDSSHRTSRSSWMFEIRATMLDSASHFNWMRRSTGPIGINEQNTALALAAASRSHGDVDNFNGSTLNYSNTSSPNRSRSNSISGMASPRIERKGSICDGI